MQAIEVKKHGYRQVTDKHQNGNRIIISFTMQPDDISAELATSPLGTVYMMELSEVDIVTAFIREDEREKKKDWDELKPSVQCALAGKNPQFQDFLGCDCEDQTVKFLKSYLTIESRAELDENQERAKEWAKLYDKFLAVTRTAEQRG